MDYETLVDFLKKNHNDIKNFDLRLSGVELVKLLDTLTFAEEIAGALASQERDRGTKASAEAMDGYVKSAADLRREIAVIIATLLTSVPANTEIN